MTRTPRQYRWTRRQWRHITSGKTTPQALSLPKDARLVRIGGDVYLYTPDPNTPNHFAKWTDDIQRTAANRYKRHTERRKTERQS